METEPPTFLPHLANTLAGAVEAELERRGVTPIRSEIEGQRPTRDIDKHFVDAKNVYQVSFLDRWPEDAHRIRAKQFIEDHLHPWSVNFGLKLARLGTVTTYPLQLPRGVEAAVLGISANLVLRVIVDYSMFDDRRVIRLDALAQWDA